MTFFLLSLNTGPRFRDWSRSIYALSRVNDHFTISVSKSQVSLSALNTSKSAYASVDFQANEFFDKFHFVEDTSDLDDTMRFSSINNRRSNKEITIEVMTKFFVSIFRRHEKENVLDRCEISLEYSDRQTPGESRLIVTLFCQFGIVKTYRLGYAKKNKLRVLDTIDDYPNSFEIKAAALKEYLDHTSARAEIFSIKFGDREVVLSSFTDAVLRNQEVLKQPLSTSIVVDQDDFDSVVVEDDSESILSLKEFKVLVQLADSFGAAIAASFSEPTFPIAFEFGSEHVTVRFLLFTGPARTGPIRSSSTTVRRRLVTRIASPPRSPPSDLALGRANTRDPEVVRADLERVRQVMTDYGRRESPLQDGPAISQRNSSAVITNPINPTRPHSALDQTRQTTQSAIATPVPPPVLPRLPLISPYTATGVPGRNSDDDEHVVEEDVVIWNSAGAAPSLQSMMQQAQNEDHMDGNEQDSANGDNDDEMEEEALFAQDEYTRVISPTQITKPREIFE
ncbi:Rad9-domain-containing protein [Lipomyces arxii]|uniref:Rad9-domain-containing protein n=1 Tax=Lipomyces arxii TaxID=56418 RepID=UPI0034CDCEED